MDKRSVAELDKTPVFGAGSEFVAPVEGGKQHPRGCGQTGTILDQQLPAWQDRVLLSDGDSENRGR